MHPRLQRLSCVRNKDKQKHRCSSLVVWYLPPPGVEFVATYEEEKEDEDEPPYQSAFIPEWFIFQKNVLDKSFRLAMMEWKEAGGFLEGENVVMDKQQAALIAKRDYPCLDERSLERGDYWSQEFLDKVRDNDKGRISYPYRWAQEPSWVFGWYDTDVHVYADGTTSCTILQDVLYDGE